MHTSFVLHASSMLYSYYTQGNFQLLVNVEDYDSDSDNELIANIFIDLFLFPGDGFNSVGSYGTNTGGYITLQFKVECNDNYYGLDCGRFCEDTDDDTGHFTCNSNGDKVCLPGWSKPSSNCLTCELSFRKRYNLRGQRPFRVHIANPQNLWDENVLKMLLAQYKSLGIGHFYMFINNFMLDRTAS